MSAELETGFEIRDVADLRSPLDIGRDEVHVWRANLDAFSSTHSFLSTDELERAGRFHFQHDRKRFAAGRQILRLLLASSLGVNAAEIEFRYSAYGKPELERPHCDLTFNVSHSGPTGMFAFARERAVGIDVEKVRPDLEVYDIARRFFSEAEQASLRSLPGKLQQAAFFSCWTRKEAFIKAKGPGLSLPLRDFDVSLVPGQPAEILATRPDPEERSRWSLWSLESGNDYAAALVVEGNDVRLKLH